jgi:catechol 2,3-dioxygenase-like lactoylglutathione lyase family enzyme
VTDVRFNHLSLVVANPDVSAAFYARYLLPEAQREWLGDSLHLRDAMGTDLAFEKGATGARGPAHHGFLADSAVEVEALLDRLRRDRITITDDCREDGFRSIKFLDADGYEIEVYWEASWPVSPLAT